MSTNRYRVKPGHRVKLSDIDPDDTALVPDGKEKGQRKAAKLGKRLATLQELLYAEHKRRVLVVLQGMDTSGKDGTVRHVVGPMNPQGVRIVSFKKPSATELERDYLWRVHANVPGDGELVVFNRSHYEDVLVVRVHELVPKEVWQKRYQQINDFERMLVESGTTILKFFLHISKDEQKKRLQERLDDPEKRWKFQHGDVEERKLWNDYTDAYEDALSKTSTDWAPWWIVPANAKWYRNYVIADVLAETLESLDMQYPAPDLSREVID